METRNLKTRPHRLSLIGEAACWTAAAAVIIVCATMLGYLAYAGLSSIDWKFLSTDPTPTLMENQAGGIRMPIVGTMLLVILCTVMVIPVATGAAVYLAEYMDERSGLTRTVRVGLEMLAGVPSVVFGMFGIALFSMSTFVLLSSSGAEGADVAFGRSFLVAATVMAIHVLPFVIKVMEEAIRSVPASYRQAAAALGMTKWRTIWRVVLPAARSSMATGVILGMGLAAGDTAIVWLTLGGTMTMGADAWWLPVHWLEVLRGTGSTLTTFVYFSSPAGEGNAPNLAFGAALVLTTLVLILNIVASLIGGRRVRNAR